MKPFIAAVAFILGIALIAITASTFVTTPARNVITVTCPSWANGTYVANTGGGSFTFTCGNGFATRAND
jgi:hypothetical protein